MCQWRQAAGYPQYQVSSHGEVVARDSAPAASHDCFTLRQTETGTMACLLNQGSREWVAVATLVAETFLGPCCGREVRHLDGDSSNDRVDNLEYAVARKPATQWATGLAAFAALVLGLLLGLFVV